jgi:hypothetical protein
MIWIRENIFVRYFWFLMAVHILNCTIDAPDTQPDNIPEDLSYNDIETLVEWVLEDVLEIENAISEHDEPDNNDGFSMEMKKTVWFHQVFELETATAPMPKGGASDREYLYFSAHFYPQHCCEVITPPPQA